MLSRSLGVTAPMQQTSYQATHTQASCACTLKPYGLNTTCIEHSPHACPGRIDPTDGKHLACGGVLQLVRAARQQVDWCETPAVLACSRCLTRVAVLLTYQRTVKPALSTFNGPCPGCQRPLVVDDKRPLVGEFFAVGDRRFYVAAFHQVPACTHFMSWDLVDVCIRVMGVPPTEVRA